MLIALITAALAAAPTFSQPLLVDPRGQSASLASAARGRRLVVVVMKGTWCSVCVGQLERLAALEAELEALDARVVGLSVDPAADTAALSARLPWAVYSDPSHAVVEALDLWRPARGHPQPGLIVYDRCGAERARQSGRGPGWRPEPALLQLLEQMAEAPAACGARAT